MPQPVSDLEKAIMQTLDLIEQNRDVKLCRYFLRQNPGFFLNLGACRMILGLSLP